MTEQGIKVICKNRKARHDYQIEEIVEAGMVLLGPEVKSLRDGRANLTDGYVAFKGDQAWLYNVHISPYPHSADAGGLDPTRSRKLLMHKRELRRLMGKVQERGLTLIPLTLYFRAGKAKVELALARGKKLFDKRESIKKRTEEREIRRRFKIH